MPRTPRVPRVLVGRRTPPAIAVAAWSWNGGVSISTCLALPSCSSSCMLQRGRRLRWDLLVVAHTTAARAAPATTAHTSSRVGYIIEILHWNEKTSNNTGWFECGAGCRT